MSTKKEEFFIISTQHGDFKTNKLTATHLKRKKWTPADPKIVLSFIPGHVVEFKVAPGDEVKEGDIILIYKAMKMNNQVKSSVNGKVKCYRVEPNVSIPKGTPILEFE
ncbi:MAG: acetyl-CoA carboxylase biotin carboxyl carrier protein subunit [Rikenellaceae bacterium]